jgi:hypothetical protein
LVWCNCNMTTLIKQRLESHAHAANVPIEKENQRRPW